MVEEATGPALPLAQVGGDAAAAILLTLLDEAEAATILGALGPDEARRIGIAMLDVSRATAADVEVALDMFVDRSRAISGLGIDAGTRVRSVFTAALGNIRAENILTEIAPQSSTGVLDKLRWMPVEAIAAALDGEHPQVAALILACLTSDVAAQALGSFDDARQSDLIYRAASLRSVSADALTDLEHLLDAYVGKRKTGSTVRIGGRSDAAKIVTKLGGGSDRRVLKHLKKRDKVLGQEIEDDMFVFDDLGALDTKNLGALLRTVDAQVLTLALRGAAAATVDKMLGCLSARAAQTIRDEIVEGAPVKRAEVEAAQKEMAATARRMAEGGDINLGGQSNDYV
jgi:flagellar motor switch protein FliG